MTWPSFIKNQPVRFFALLCVAITSAYVMWMGWQQHTTLASSDWCARAVKAEQITGESRFSALQACIDLQKVQIEGIVTNSLVNSGTICLCLLSLMVIVVAGGHLSFSSKLGSANIGGGPVADAAQHVADEAQVAANEVKVAETAPAKPDDPRIPDHAKP